MDRFLVSSPREIKGHVQIDFKYLLCLPRLPEKEGLLFYAIVIDMKPASNDIIFTADCKRKLAIRLGTNKRYISRCIDNLCKKDLLRKVCNGKYMINPFVAIKCKRCFLSELINNFMQINSYEKQEQMKSLKAYQSSINNITDITDITD